MVSFLNYTNNNGFTYVRAKRHLAIEFYFYRELTFKSKTRRKADKIRSAVAAEAGITSRSFVRPHTSLRSRRAPVSSSAPLSGASVFVTAMCNILQLKS